MNRAGGEPSAEDTFLVRICKALDTPPRMLAYRIGVPYSELEPLLSRRYLLAEIDRDEVWWKINEYAGRRLGEILAIRAELNKALQQDRTKRVARLARHGMYKRKGPGRAAQ